MSLLQPVVDKIGSLPLSRAIAESAYLFPAFESAHVLALGIVFGSIAAVDLRLLNLRLTDQSVMSLTNRLLPFTWIAFVGAVITGVLMFIADPGRYLENLPFQLKFLLLALAGVNMAINHFFVSRNMEQWGQPGHSTSAAKISGGISLLLWTLIIFAGRWIGFS